MIHEFGRDARILKVRFDEFSIFLIVLLRGLLREDRLRYANGESQGRKARADRKSVDQMGLLLGRENDSVESCFWVGGGRYRSPSRLKAARS
ncbi:MAG: hypothetical protein ABIR28_04595, partial [Vicinamibacteria bacterium]